MNKELKQLIQLVESKGRYQIVESKYHSYENHRRYTIYDKKLEIIEAQEITSNLLKRKLRMMD